MQDEHFQHPAAIESADAPATFKREFEAHQPRLFGRIDKFGT
jgi:hypothetical protein